MIEEGATAAAIRIVALDAPDLRSAVGSANKIHHSNAGFAELTYWSPPATLEELAASLERRSADLDDVDVMILSVGLAAPFDDRSADLDDWFTTPVADTISVLKRHGVFVIVLNGSTFDPQDTSRSWNLPEPPASLMVHRLDTALIELSVLDGVSILDMDRIVAEIGGHDAVRSLLDYTQRCPAMVSAEIMRILEDSRFFSPGPNVEQLGRRQDSRAV